MKRLLLGIVCALFFALPAHANGNYIEGTAAHSSSNDLDHGSSGYSMASGYLIGLAIGGVMANQVSIEGEVSYSTRDYEHAGSSLVAMAVMANLFYNFPIANSVNGYLGLGAGPTRVEFDGGGSYSSWSDEQWVLGYQFMIGLTYGMANGVTLFSEYRYQAAQDADLAGADVEYNSHNLGGGVRVGF